MFYYAYDYEKRHCYDVDCFECKKKLFCIHYTPDPDGPAWQNDDKNEEEVEYRLFVEKVDDTTNALIKNITDIILKNTKVASSKSIEKDVMRLVKIWYSLGYKVKDILYFRDFYTLLNAYYKYILPTLSDTIKLNLENYLFEYYQHDSSPNVNNDNFDDLELSSNTEFNDDSSFVDLPVSIGELREIVEFISTNGTVPDEAVDLWLMLRTYNSFNGYVKVKEEYDPDHPDNLEFNEQDQKVSHLVQEAYKLIKEIFLVTSGKTAYAKSEKLKSILLEIKTYSNTKFYDVKDLTHMLKRKAKKAWELRKKHKNSNLEEKREIFRKEFGY